MRRDPSDDLPPKPTPPPGSPDVLKESKADQDHFKELQRARQARVAKVVVALAIVVILMIFIIANSEGQPVSFVFFERRPPLIWVMFACAVLGGIVGFLIGRPGKQVRLHKREQEKRS